MDDASSRTPLSRRRALGLAAAAVSSVPLVAGAASGRSPVSPRQVTAERRARSASGASRSTAYTSPVTSASTAVWYPLPAPTSSTLERTSTLSSEVMSATMYGCEIVWPWPMAKGWSS
jgi:hypothetical protein